MIENLNILVHLMEWHSMLFIILTQKNRPVQEILADHENEPMSTNILQGIRCKQKIYRRAEIALMRIFKGLTVFIIVYHLVASIFWIMGSVYASYMLFFISFVACLDIAVIYSILNPLMMRLHHFEYQRTKKSMFLQFVLFQVVCILFMMFNSIMIYSNQVVKGNLQKERIRVDELQYFRYMCQWEEYFTVTRLAVAGFAI